MNLESFGWHSFFAETFQPYAEEGYGVGRVAVQHKSHYVLYTTHGELRAKVAGKMHYLSRGPEDLPVVGDWVIIRPREQEGAATIYDILPRKSQFVRKAAGPKVEEQVIAANIDVIFLVNGLDGNFNLRRIERYLVLSWESGAKPIIVLNKADLCDDVEQKIQEVKAVALGVPVLATSAVSGEGLEALIACLGKGTTGALLGSSGVGKSTIINQLLGTKILKTQEVREADDRGRHTTARRELILLPNGGLLMDTPGMRELQLWGGEEGLKDAFEDIAELAQQCRFRDCQHGPEPGCAVRQALEDGTLDADRFASYQKLQKEIAYLNRKEDKTAELLEKQRWKKITSAHKKFSKRR
ncbi:MAG: ribosome small subunit-dependent GTPase A [candidate division KSB1 bacterium]|nr:ribosome small subunit-dependent GTPase A [candidate division KSB1 bacterium]